MNEGRTKGEGMIGDAMEWQRQEQRVKVDICRTNPILLLDRVSVNSRGASRNS